MLRAPRWHCPRCRKAQLLAERLVQLPEGPASGPCAYSAAKAVSACARLTGLLQLGPSDAYRLLRCVAAVLHQGASTLWAVAGMPAVAENHAALSTARSLAKQQLAAVKASAEIVTQYVEQRPELAAAFGRTIIKPDALAAWLAAATCVLCRASSAGAKERALCDGAQVVGLLMLVHEEKMYSPHCAALAGDMSSQSWLLTFLLKTLLPALASEATDMRLVAASDAELALAIAGSNVPALLGWLPRLLEHVSGSRVPHSCSLALTVAVKAAGSAATMRHAVTIALALPLGPDAHSSRSVLGVTHLAACNLAALAALAGADAARLMREKEDNAGLGEGEARTALEVLPAIPRLAALITAAAGSADDGEEAEMGVLCTSLAVLYTALGAAMENIGSLTSAQLVHAAAADATLRLLPLLAASAPPASAQRAKLQRGLPLEALYGFLTAGAEAARDVLRAPDLLPGLPAGEVGRLAAAFVALHARCCRAVHWLRAGEGVLQKTGTWRAVVAVLDDSLGAPCSCWSAAPPLVSALGAAALQPHAHATAVQAVVDPAWEQPTKLGLHWILLIGSLLLIPPDHDRLISPALGHLIHNTLRGYAGKTRSHPRLAAALASGGALAMMSQENEDALKSGAQKSDRWRSSPRTALDSLIRAAEGVLESCANGGGSGDGADLQQALRAAVGELKQQAELACQDTACWASADLAHACEATAALLWQHWQRPEQVAEDRLWLARAVATRSCAFLCCSNLGGEGGPTAGDGDGSSRCGGCRAAWYCGTACSHADWRPAHRHVCGELAGALAAKTAGK